LVLPWHFKEEFLEREKSFLEAGGHFLFPLPKISVYGKDYKQIKGYQNPIL
jgi:NDP-4-keto-2,6-dideoxyhexose 3-C-methyltransferase